jgi:uncharacterized protein YjbI with pentapeptide repeats
LGQAKLNGVDLGWANLREADLSLADLHGANLREADLRWANLREANLREADLHWARLHWARLHWADLSLANLREAGLREANLSGANLREADLSLADLLGADLREANLSGANLREADLSLTDLRWANLSGANLREADLHGAYLRGTDLRGANLHGVELENALSAPADDEGGDTSMAASVAPASPPLKPVRDFIEPNEIPPEGVGAYGMVAFTHKATLSTRKRFTFICDAFLSTLPPRQSLPASVPPSQLMITYWPLERREPERIAAGDCGYLIDRYDLASGLEAIRDADLQRKHLAERRGPFLIGWSPAQSRYEQDAVVLVMDLSAFDSEASFVEAFQSWRTKITDNPELWRNGFSIEQVRLALRDFLDRYGETILQAIRPG